MNCVTIWEAVASTEETSWHVLLIVVALLFIPKFRGEARIDTGHLMLVFISSYTDLHSTYIKYKSIQTCNEHKHIRMHNRCGVFLKTNVIGGCTSQHYAELQGEVVSKTSKSSVTCFMDNPNVEQKTCCFNTLPYC